MEFCRDKDKELIKNKDKIPLIDADYVKATLMQNLINQLGRLAIK